MVVGNISRQFHSNNMEDRRGSVFTIDHHFCVSVCLCLSHSHSHTPLFISVFLSPYPYLYNFFQRFIFPPLFSIHLKLSLSFIHIYLSLSLFLSLSSLITLLSLSPFFIHSLSLSIYLHLSFSLSPFELHPIYQALLKEESPLFTFYTSSRRPNYCTNESGS